MLHSRMIHFFISSTTTSQVISKEYTLTSCLISKSSFSLTTAKIWFPLAKLFRQIYINSLLLLNFYLFTNLFIPSLYTIVISCSLRKHSFCIMLLDFGERERVRVSSWNLLLNLSFFLLSKYALKKSCLGENLSFYAVN